MYKLKSRVIFLNEVPNKQSSTTRRVYDSTVKEYGIEDKVVSVTTDNAGDMKCSFGDKYGYRIRWFGCAAHQGCTGLRHCFGTMEDPENQPNYNEILTLLAVCKRLVTYVKRSGKQHLFEHTFKSDIDVRFDSKCLMTGSVRRNRPRLETITDPAIKEIASGIDFDLLDKLVDTLELVYNGRMEISAADRSSMHLVYPMKHLLVRKLETRTFDTRIDRMRSLLAKCLKETLIVTEDHKLATYLSPLFRSNRELISKEDRERFKEKIRSELGFVNLSSAEELIEQPTAEFSFLGDLVSQESDDEDSSDEVSIYDSFRFKTEHKLNPLMFWIDNASQMPKLSDFALRMHLHQPTSMLCERLFSSCGFTVNKHRNALSPESLESCLLVRSNSDLVK